MSTKTSTPRELFSKQTRSQFEGRKGRTGQEPQEHHLTEGTLQGRAHRHHPKPQQPQPRGFEAIPGASAKGSGRRTPRRSRSLRSSSLAWGSVGKWPVGRVQQRSRGTVSNPERQRAEAKIYHFAPSTATGAAETTLSREAAASLVGASPTALGFPVARLSEAKRNKSHPQNTSLAQRAAAQQKPSTRCWPCHCLCSGCSSAASLSLSAPSSATSLAGLFPSRHEPELQQALTNHPPRLRNFITQAGQERERRGKKPSHQQQGTLPGVLQQPHDKTAERCRLPARQPTCSEPSTPGGDQGRGSTAKEAAWRRREGRDRAGSSRQCQRPRQRGHGCPEARCLGGAAVTSLAHAATARCGFGCPAEDSEGLEGLHAHRLAAATTGTGNNGVRRSDGHQNPRRTSQEGETRG